MNQETAVCNGVPTPFVGHLPFAETPALFVSTASRVQYGYFNRSAGIRPQGLFTNVTEHEQLSTRQMFVLIALSVIALVTDEPTWNVVYRPGAGIANPLDIAQLPKGACEAVSDLRRKLREYGRFQENWDEEGAAPIGSETVKTAEAVLDKVSRLMHERPYLPTPLISPRTDGTVALIWEVKERELQLTARGPIVTAARWSPPSSYEAVLYEDTTVEHIGEHFRWLLEKQT